MSNINFNQYPPKDYISLVRSQAIRPRFRLSLLYDNENFRKDITEYLIDGSGSLQIQYGQGRRRSINFTLDNSSGIFTPNGINSDIWVNSKFKLELGMETSSGDIVWNSAGIFVIGTPQAMRQNAQHTIDIQCYDKFALLDGTLGGTLEATYEINAGEKIYNIVIDTTKDINTVKTSKKVIMAIKAVKRIQDKWKNYGFEYTIDAPDFWYENGKGFHHWCILLTKFFKGGQSTINICYDVSNDPAFPNYTISAYNHIKGYEESQTFHWNEYLLNLLNEQINCIDDAVCILEHPDEMLG